MRGPGLFSVATQSGVFRENRSQVAPIKPGALLVR